MLGPVARSRLLAGSAALLTLTGASAALGIGSSDPTGAPARAAVSAPFVGPVAPPPVPQPLVRTDGPLLPYLPTRLVPRPPAMGPHRDDARSAAVPAGVGPDSSVAQIRALQRQLNSRGAQLRVDGAWGPATARAVALLGR